MSAILPPQYAVDAVPEKRTQDEEHMPPAAVQADEMLSRVEEKAKSEGKAEKKQQSGEGSSSAEASKQPEAQDAKDKSKKSRSKASWDKKHESTRKVNVFNVSQCNGFHLGHNYEFHNNFVAAGPSARTEPKDPPSGKRDASPHAELPRKLFKSLKAVTKEDCTHISDYVSCNWEELGVLLFLEETSRLEQYRAEMERNSKKKKQFLDNQVDISQSYQQLLSPVIITHNKTLDDQAVQLILEEWRKFAGKYALVGRLSRELLKLNEIEALKKLAKRLNLD